MSLSQQNGGDTSPEFSGKTTFGKIARFDKISEDQMMPTEQFLQACTDVAHILDRLGTCFALPKKDIIGNIKKIDDRYKTNPKLYVTLNAILEEDSHAQKKPTYTAVGFIWLKRGLDFIRAFIAGLSWEYHNNVQDENLRQTLLKAYDSTLKSYHGTMAQFLFSNVSRLVPYRKDFLQALMLTDDATIDMVISDIDLYLPNLQANIDLLQELLNHYGLNDEGKV